MNAPSLTDALAARLDELNAPAWQKALARTLAGEIEGDEPLAARVSAAKTLVEVMASVQAAAPAKPEADRVDELTKRRKARRAS